MSTHPGSVQSVSSVGALGTRPARHSSAPTADVVARIVLGRRDALLRRHAHRLRPEELEDCFGQAALELLARTRRGPNFSSSLHVENALEQKLLSRVADRRRAVSGRSAIETAIERAPSTDDPEGEASRIPDRGAGPDELAVRRAELAKICEVAHELSADQRLFVGLHDLLGMGCDEFCRRHGWSAEKFRKVGQRARRRLGLLLADYASGVRCRDLEEDLLGEAKRLSGRSQSPVVGMPITPDRTRRVHRHTANCASCRRLLTETLRPPPSGLSHAPSDGRINSRTRQ